MIRSLNRWKGIWFAALFALLLIGLTALSQPAFAEIASGTCGTCSWVIDDDGVLTIRPTDGTSGTLQSYLEGNTGSPSWYNYRQNITKVVVQSGVATSAGCHRLFMELSNCTEMDLVNLDTRNATTMCTMFRGCSSQIIIKRQFRFYKRIGAVLLSQAC